MQYPFAEVDEWGSEGEAMENKISPKYLMGLITKIENALWEQFKTDRDVGHYIEKWHESNGEGWQYSENFCIYSMKKDGKDVINLEQTLHEMEGETLLRIAIDLEIDTPDFIPSISMFKNDLKDKYPSASKPFELAAKKVYEDPDIAIGLANSALESICKEILKDPNVNCSPKQGHTLYTLAEYLLKFLEIYPKEKSDNEFTRIGSGLLTVLKNIEALRSTKTSFHGKANSECTIDNPIHAFFIINSTTTVGLFLMSLYKHKFVPITPVESNKN